MNSIAKTFGAIALGAVVAGGGTVFYDDYQNDTREAAELEEALSINPVINVYISMDGDLKGYYFRCNKDMRYAEIDYPNEKTEWDNDLKEYIVVNPDRVATMIVKDGMTTIFQDTIDSNIVGTQATLVAELFCHKGEFSGPTAE